MNNVLILLNYNDYDTTSHFLELHRHSKYIDKIVVVDNFSSDGSYEKLKNIIKNFNADLIRTDRNSGYASGNNFGAFYAIDKFNPCYITIANPDTILNDDNFYYIFKAFEKKKDAALVSCVMESKSNIRILSAWKEPTYIKCLIACMFGFKNLFKKYTEYDKKYLSLENDKIQEVDVVAGSFFIIKSEIFQYIKGFDKNTFLYYEEAILGKRIRQCNYKLYIECSTVYIHAHSASIDKNISAVGKKLDILQESRVYYCKTYLNANKIQIVLLELMFLIGKLLYLGREKIKSKSNIVMRSK